jgi:hypothetical protein
VAFPHLCKCVVDTLVAEVKENGSARSTRLNVVEEGVLSCDSQFRVLGARDGRCANEAEAVLNSKKKARIGKSGGGRVRPGSDPTVVLTFRLIQPVGLRFACGGNVLPE